MTKKSDFCVAELDGGACARRCPGGAIPKDGPKDHLLCLPVVGKSKLELAPRYGCGLCQTAVPCESGIPPKKH